MTRFVTLAEYFWLAEQVTGTPASVLVHAARVDLADPALHAPAAGFGHEEFYPEIFDKAAVLTCRLAWNHPLLDGNKRAAWATLVMFVDLNGGTWEPDPPDVDQAYVAMLAGAGRGVDAVACQLASCADPVPITISSALGRAGPFTSSKSCGVISSNVYRS